MGQATDSGDTLIMSDGIKTAEALDGLNIEALNKLTGVLAKDTIEDMNALELFIWLKRLQGLADSIMTNIMPDANAEFAKLAASNPKAKAWPATEFATVAKFAQPGTWVFPEDLVKREAELKSDKEAAKVSGAAKKVTPEPNPEKSVLFKVQLQVL